MRRWLMIAATAALLAGCIGVNPEPERDVLGVSAAQPAAGAAAAGQTTDAVLAWKVSQLCTSGATLLKRDALAAEQGQQLISQELRCNPYAYRLPMIGAVPEGPSLPAVFGRLF